MFPDVDWTVRGVTVGALGLVDVSSPLNSKGGMGSGDAGEEPESDSAERWDVSRGG